MGAINIYILTAILVLDGIAVAFLSYQITKLRDKISTFDTIHNSQAQIYRESLDENWNNYKQLYDAFLNMNKMNDLIYQQYKDMYALSKSQSEVQNKIFEQYKYLSEIHTNLFEAVKDIDERYADTCDQFEEIAKGQADIYAKVQELNEHFQPIELSGFDEDEISWDDDLDNDNEDIYPWGDKKEADEGV